MLKEVQAALAAEFGPAARLAIIDLEATTSEDETLPRKEREIIEIGLVSFALSPGEAPRLLSEWQRFVAPVRHPQLLRFCTELTGITQQMLAGAPGFPQAYGELLAHLQAQEIDGWLSWGDYDRRQFRLDCKYHQLEGKFGPHANLKKLLAKVHGWPQRVARRGGSRALRFAV